MADKKNYYEILGVDKKASAVGKVVRVCAYTRL